MMSQGEIQGFINLDLEFIQQSGQIKPEPWGTSQPNNAYEDLSWAEQAVIGHETRLESGQILSDATFHPSIAVAPTKLDKPKYMITLDDLKKKFGSSWTPKYASLNEFEQKCKDHWGKPLVRYTFFPLLSCIVLTLFYRTPAQRNTIWHWEVRVSCNSLWSALIAICYVRIPRCTLHLQILQCTMMGAIHESA